MSNTQGMIKNYFKLAIRNLWKNKLISLTNLLGLTLGISCSLLLLLYVKYEYSFDKFVPEKDNTYLLYGIQTGANERKVGLSVEEDYLDLRDNYAGVKEVARIRNSRYSFLPNGNVEKKIEALDFHFASSNFFDFFGFPLIEGDSETALADPSSIVITQSTAIALFGTEDALGKTVTIDGAASKKDLIVRGVAKDVKNSHIQFQAILPWDLTFPNGSQPAKGFAYSLYTYVKTVSGSISEVSQLKNEKLRKDPNFQGDFSVAFFPVADLYLKSGDIQFLFFNPGSESSIQTLLFIAIVILIVACINYINLQTAKGTKRSLEVGVRKVLGAHRGQLMGQFLGEAILITIVSAIFSVLIIDLALSPFNQLTGKSFEMTDLMAEGLVSFLAMVVVFTSLFSGLIQRGFPLSSRLKHLKRQ